MNGDILEAIKERHKQCYKYRKKRDQKSQAEYKTLKNEVLIDCTKRRVLIRSLLTQVSYENWL